MALTTNHHQHRGSGRVLFYAIVVFAVCWLQLSANVFVYFLKHKNNYNYIDSTLHRSGRFSVSRRKTSVSLVSDNGTDGSMVAASSENNNNDSSKDNGSSSNASNNLRSGKTSGSREKDEEEGHASLEAQLLNLFQRLERVKKNLEDEIVAKEESSIASVVVSSNQTKNTILTNANTTHALKRKVFVPFTIRDAQRTVPTQIPHGFEVFDFIDLYATNGDQKQTGFAPDVTSSDHLRSKWTNRKKNNNSNKMDDDEDFVRNTLMTATKATLFRNGKPIPEADKFGSECLGYSKKCYRSKLLKVIRYLLSLRKTTHDKSGSDSEGDSGIEYYYFYMEADNDLCVPLSEIRDLAFKYQRYFVSTGTGASGWIMNENFLDDFYLFWNTLKKNGNTEGLSEEEILEPDSVAAVLLKQNRAWSVTRRYLTSHSILSGNTEDEASIAALYERVEPVVENSTTTEKEQQQQDAAAAKVKVTTKKKKKETPEEASLNAPLMEPSRYLPRCLEPHRGVWRNNETKNNDGTGGVTFEFDVHHWGFFDYDLCPESDIFPCAEGQLEKLARQDPYFQQEQQHKQATA